MTYVPLPLAVYRWGWRLWVAAFVALESTGAMTEAAAWAWLAAFVVLEVLAVLDPREGDTLTENVRPLLHLHPLGWFLAAGAMAWLAVHVLVDGMRPLLGQDTVIATLRPYLHSHPLARFLTGGALAWLAVHFLVPTLELRVGDIMAAARRWPTSSAEGADADR